MELMEKPKVLIIDPKIQKIAVQKLSEKCQVIICEKSTREEILEKVKNVNGIIWSPQHKLNSEILDTAGKQLKVISLKSVGLDSVDLEELKSRKILLGHTPTIPKHAVADLAMGLAIAAARRFHEGRKKIESSQWERRPRWLLGQEIRNSTVGIVGFGAVGSTIAKRLQGFDVKEFLYCGHSRKPSADQYGAKFVSFDELCRRSDFIFICCPLTDKTKLMFDSEAFSKMKQNAILINVARGGIVDHDELYDALKNNKIFAAGLDVVTPEPLPSDHKLLKLDNCIITPHYGTATAMTRDEMASVAAENILRGLANEPLLYSAFT